MSRVVWGHGDKQKKAGVDGVKQQTTLDGFVTVVRHPPQRRQRVDNDDEGEGEAAFLAPLPPQTQLSSVARARSASASVASSASAAATAVQREGSKAAAVSMMLRPSAAGASAIAASDGDDGVLYGPSGGGNRETQGKRPPRMFMNGKERSAAADANPYSRDFQREWSSQRAQNRQQTTDMDPAIVAARYGIANGGGGIAAAAAPPQIFAGKVFFLNSCDADGQISVFNLEKLIRHLGGSTAMGVGRHVDYIVTQHVASNKTRLLAAGNRTGLAVHPHWVLDSAKRGALLPTKEYETRDGQVVKCTATAAAVKAAQQPPSKQSSDVIEID